MVKIKIKFHIIIILSYCFILFFGCFKKQQKDMDSVVALVNNQEIYVGDINFELDKNINEFDDPLFDIKHNVNVLKRRILNTLIDNELLYQAAQECKITINHEEMKKFVFKIAKGLGPEEFKTDQYLVDPKFEKWREATRRDLMIQKLIDNKISNKINLTAEELFHYFQSHLTDFSTDKQIRVKQIIVDSEIEAKEILNQLKQKADFDKLATERSRSQDSSNGGDMGFFSSGQLPPEFDDVLFALNKGDISDIVCSDYGYHIFQVVDIIDYKKASFEESKDKIRDILLKRKRDGAFQEYLENLRASATVKINPQALF